jgi:hypothetical protein
MQDEGAAGVGGLEIDLSDGALRRWVQSHLPRTHNASRFILSTETNKIRRKSNN